jgi:penicillin V acylase-like amidase (Ntn superfamily)
MNKHITTREEAIQLTRRQLLGRGIDYPSTLGGAQLCFPRNAETLSSDVYPSQVPEQWEGTHLISAS